MDRNDRPLDLPAAVVRGTPVERSSRRRRRPSRWTRAWVGLAFLAGGATILLALTRLPESLDALLLFSRALHNLIEGLSLLALGVLQLTGLLLVAVLALLALLLLVGGAVRLVRALLPGSSGGP